MWLKWVATAAADEYESRLKALIAAAMANSSRRACISGSNCRNGRTNGGDGEDLHWAGPGVGLQAGHGLGLRKSVPCKVLLGKPVKVRPVTVRVETIDLVSLF